ncbi:hypothetical protein D9M71_476630 [compost metagenome]
MHLHLHQRIGLGEALEDVRQEAHHVVVRRADTHRADHVRLAQGVEHLPMQLEDAPRIAEQHLSLRRQPHLAAVALEQRALQHVVLQTLHLHAHCRLGAVHHFRCAGEAAVIGDRHEGAQQFGVDAGEVGHSSISEMNRIRMIRWIDLMPGERLLPTHLGGQQDERSTRFCFTLVPH